MFEYKIIASYYKFSMPFIYNGMVGYARHVNRYFFFKLLITLWLLLPLHYVTAPPIFFTGRDHPFVFSPS